MAKGGIVAAIMPMCTRMAEEMGYELVDVALEKEHTGLYLRIFLDKPEGLSLDDCEKYHKAIQPKLENYEYDFLEVSSPGLDRPLKSDRDFERNLGMEVELHLFKAIDGSKTYTGVLTAFTKDEITLAVGESEMTIGRKAASLVKPVVDMTGVDEIEL